jgi:hypothetical protein
MKMAKVCLGLVASLSLALAAGGCSTSECPVHRLLYGSKKAVQEAGPQTACPILGDAVDKKLFVDSQGKRIYVCCAACLPKVRKDPAKYISQLEAAGVVLDKVPPAQP